ncbi:TonB-dependent receptor [Foetidibacter luteolus]|uniref:TonB-dependent receptor n=1 Tax=Foetidibacter luteolus TaxID=2608880 RepID=UPI00129B986B|nr:TonB-dependent receptor [Foetidibacter luteolus]
MKRLLSLSFFCLTIFSAANANHHYIKGVIKDEQTQLPLSFVTISVKETAKAAITDELGKFIFGDLKESTYTLVISSIGYMQQTVTLQSAEDEAQTVHLSLRRSYLALADVTVTANTLLHSTNTIGAIDMKLRPVRTSQDLLRCVPGLFIAQHAGGGKAEQIFLRGFDIDHGTDVNISVDGIPVNMVSHAHGQGYADLHFLIPETIEKLDFGKGPYYTGKGDFTTAGYVAFTTKDALDNNEVKLEAGNFSTMRALALLNIIPKQKRLKNPNQSAYIAAEYNYSNGPFTSPQYFNRYNVFAKYRTLIGKKNLLNISASDFGSKWNASGQIPERAVKQGLIGRFGSIDDSEGGSTGRTNINLQLKTQLNERTTLSQQLFYSNYRFELFSNFTFFLNDPVNGDEIRQYEKRNLGGYNMALQKKWALGNRDAESTWSAGSRYDATNGSRLSRAVKRMPLNEDYAWGNIRQLNSWVYWDNAIAITDKLQLNAGVRYDYFYFNYADLLRNAQAGKAHAGTLSPKLNLNYRLSNVLNLYVKTGKSFHSNDARVSVLQNGRQIAPAAYGFDIGADGKLGEHVFFNLAFWQLNLDQEFVYVGDEAIVEPGGKSRRRGIDFSLRTQIAKWLYADVDANYASPVLLNVPKNENRIPLAPRFSSMGGLSAKFSKGIEASLRYRWLPARPANETNTVRTRGYFVNDAVLRYSNNHWQYQLTIENLLNTDWNEAQFDTESRLRNEQEPVTELHYTPGVPFSIRVGVGYRF